MDPVMENVKQVPDLIALKRKMLKRKLKKRKNSSNIQKKTSQKFAPKVSLNDLVDKFNEAYKVKIDYWNNEFHRSVFQFFQKRGFITKKQLDAIKNTKVFERRSYPTYYEPFSWMTREEDADMASALGLDEYGT